jgi:hypothetical protein
MEIFAGGRVANRKPSPDIYNLAKGYACVCVCVCVCL